MSHAAGADIRTQGTNHSPASWNEAQRVTLWWYGELSIICLLLFTCVFKKMDKKKCSDLYYTSCTCWASWNTCTWIYCQVFVYCG